MLFFFCSVCVSVVLISDFTAFGLVSVSDIEDSVLFQDHSCGNRTKLPSYW